MLFAELLLGWIFADFLSGVVHWVEDTFVTRDTPLIGKSVGLPNEMHHADPAAFLASGFIERNWTTWAAVLPLALLWLWLWGPSVTLLAALVGGCLANESHAWAHRSNPPPIIRALQRSGVFQASGAHARHHRSKMDSDFCTLTGWLNPWLELIGLWRWLSKTVATVGLVQRKLIR